MNFIKILSSIIFCFILINSCNTNPLTGRKSLNLVSNSQILSSSFQQYEKVITSSHIIIGTADAIEVKNVGIRIKNAAEIYYKSIGKESALNGYEWEFNLINDSKTINAWCMPGGKVAVYTGIMPICKTENGLAVVLGHEVAHALAGHGAERISQQYITNIGGQLLGGFINNGTLKNVVDKFYPVASQVTLLKYGRSQETDADITGLYIMAMAGYDPREAPLFWERMVQNTGNDKNPQFLSTHPNPQNRIEDIKKAMPKAIEYYNNAKLGITPKINSNKNTTKNKDKFIY